MGDHGEEDYYDDQSSVGTAEGVVEHPDGGSEAWVSPFGLLGLLEDARVSQTVVDRMSNITARRIQMDCVVEQGVSFDAAQARKKERTTQPSA